MVIQVKEKTNIGMVNVEIEVAKMIRSKVLRGETRTKVRGNMRGRETERGRLTRNRDRML